MKRSQIYNLLDQYFSDCIESKSNWRKVVCLATNNGILFLLFHRLCPIMMDTDLLACHKILQAQRDYFGAYTYERVDSPRGNFII